MGIKRLILNIRTFARQNPVEFWSLVIILVVGAFCRLYKIDQYMTFLGDEGRDVIIVRRIFTEIHPPLIGPGTSVGDMYLGPLYYYLMAIPLLLAGFSPVGPAVMIAILAVATIGFIWWVGRTWFGKNAGLIAAGLYAISPTAIIFSHSSWNPNIMPFFALLSIYSIWKVWSLKKFNWLIVLGVSFAFVLQSHYLGLLLVPTLFLFWVFTLRDLRLTGNCKLEIGKFLKKSLLGFLIFLCLMSPLLIFDLRHNFMNFKAIDKFLLERDTTVSGNFWLAISKLPDVFKLINASLLTVKNNLLAVISSIMILAGTIYLFIENFVKHKNFNIKKEYWLILSWLIFGLIGFSIYKQNIYDHYFEFLFPVPFLLTGIIISKLISRNFLVKIFGGTLLIGLVVINLNGNPLRKEPNRLLKRSQDVSRSILDKVDGKPFNLAVIAERNYEDGYRYFLELWGGKVLHADRWDPATISDTLIVVCENTPSTCDPTHSAKAEVANFGWSKIDTSWEVDGVTIYKLVHSR